jgi:hypothetical protein
LKGKATPETIQKRADKALLVLRKSAIIAAQRKWITQKQCDLLTDDILHFEANFRLPRSEEESTSAAILPF